MEGGLFLDVVVGESAAIFQLLTSKDETLLVWRDALFVLDFGLDILNRITGLNLQGDCLACEGFHKDLHTSSQTEHKMEGGLFLDVVVGESAAVFQLLTSKDETLLVWRDALFVLDFCFDILNRITGLNLKGDCLACEGFHKDLHTSSQTEHKMEGGLFLDVIVWQGAAVFQLLTSKDQPLLVWRDAFLILDLSFDILNSITWLDLQSDGLTSQGLHKDLHLDTVEGIFKRVRSRH